MSEDVFCKHCHRRIEGWLHVDGGQKGLMSCDTADSGLPYGYNAHPVGTPCERPCVGEEQP